MKRYGVMFALLLSIPAGIVAQDAVGFLTPTPTVSTSDSFGIKGDVSRECMQD